MSTPSQPPPLSNFTIDATPENIFVSVINIVLILLAIVATMLYKRRRQILTLVKTIANLTPQGFVLNQIDNATNFSGVN